MFIRTSLLSCLIFVFFAGCKKENSCDCIKRTGSIIREERALEAFDKVFVEDNVNVFIEQDSVFSATVEAGEHIAGLIRTEIKDGTLFIHNDNRCNWTRSYDKPLNVYVKMPVVHFVTSKGTGNIKSVNVITTDTVDLETKSSGNIDFTVSNNKVLSHMFGYGDILLHGTTHEHACSIGGDGFLFASALHTDYTYIHTFTSGLSYVRTNGLLICRIDEDGDVYCYGGPATIQRDLRGAGHLYLK